jgi:predicted kinase
MDVRPDVSALPEPLLVLVTGVQGTGKSTVAEAIARMLGSAVLAHDWAMSGLRPYRELQITLDEMRPPGHRVVGWSILTALARLQVRQGRSVVLDGVARSPEIERCQETARSEGARLVVVETYCSDVALHRSRVEGRQRSIPNWYELDWPHVKGSREKWRIPDGVDLRLDAASHWDANAALLRALISS